MGQHLKVEFPGFASGERPTAHADELRRAVLSSEISTRVAMLSQDDAEAVLTFIESLQLKEESQNG